VGPQTAAILNLPFVTGAVAIEKTDDGVKVKRRADGFVEKFEMTFPAALTIHPAAVKPRDAGFGSIATAYDSHSVERWTLKDLGLSAKQVGEGGSPTRVVSLNRVKKERKCEFLSGESEEQAETLIS
jgi:electron transfer flavoprotein beta subunit